MSTEPGLTEYVTTTLRHRSKVVKNNIENNNAAFVKMKEEGAFESYSGGRSIVEELSFDDNSSFGWFEGAQVLSTAYNPTLTAAEYSHRQAACAVFISEYERLINSGSEGIIKLVGERTKVAESTMMNKVNAAFFGDGTGSGGKEMGGLALLVAQNPATGTVGTIDRSTSAGTFFRNYALGCTATFGAAKDASNIKRAYTRAKINVTRGSDGPNIVLAGNTDYEAVMGASQAIQQLSDPKLAKLGFENIMFCGMPVVLCGGVNFGGETLIGDAVSYMLNTKYLKLRYHKDCWMDVMEERMSVNQLASVKFLALMGNFTLSNAKLQAYVYDA